MPAALVVLFRIRSSGRVMRRGIYVARQRPRTAQHARASVDSLRRRLDHARAPLFHQQGAATTRRDQRSVVVPRPRHARSDGAAIAWSAVNVRRRDRSCGASDDRAGSSRRSLQQIAGREEARPDAPAALCPNAALRARVDTLGRNASGGANSEQYDKRGRHALSCRATGSRLAELGIRFWQGAGARR